MTLIQRYSSILNLNGVFANNSIQRAQFAPLDDLVIKSTDEEYPTTASLADQQECVDLIESIAVETSNKLTDLDSKIAETAQKNRLLDDKLAAMKQDLEEMNAGIDSINALQYICR